MNEKMRGFFAAILLIGCVSCGTVGETTQCPSADWTSFGAHCYTAVNHLLSWQESEDNCQILGGHLFSAINKTEEDVVTSLVPSGEKFWIGLAETEEEGVYIWSDGSLLLFHNFAASEPKISSENSCVYLQKNSTVSDWYTQTCSVQMKSICELDTAAVTAPPPTPFTQSPVSSTTASTSTKHCPLGWLQVEDLCYQTAGSMKNWTDALLACKEMGAELATIHSHAVQSALMAELVFAIKSPVWIGLYATSENFTWEDGSDLDFVKWARNEPSGDSDHMRCVELLNNKDETGRWNDENCGLLGSYACQKPSDESYPTPGPIISLCDMPGFLPYRDACFHIMTTPMNFSQAQVSCEGKMANLASVVDGYEEGFVETLLFQNNLESAWIGLNDVKDEGVFVWTDTWPVWYTNWGHSEPSRGEGEGCVALNSDGTWNDMLCAEQRPAICKITSEKKPTDPPLIEGYCPSGWTDSGNYCYLVNSSGPELYTWDDANRECRSKGSELVSIHSKYENEFVESLIKANPSMEDFYWIGLYRNDEDGFSWTDFSPLEYDNWQNRQPSTDDEQYRCGMYSSQFGQWSIANCIKTEGFICKTPKIPGTSPRPTTLRSSTATEATQRSTSTPEGTSVTTQLPTSISQSVEPSAESSSSTKSSSPLTESQSKEPTTLQLTSETPTLIAVPSAAKDLSIGAIVGICFASVAILCVILVAIILSTTKGRVSVPKFSSSSVTGTISNAVFVYDSGGASMRVDDQANILDN